MEEIEKAKLSGLTPREVMDKIRNEINEDKILGRLMELYPVQPLLEFDEITLNEKIEKAAYRQKEFRLKYLLECAKVETIKELYEKRAGEIYEQMKNGEVTLTKTEIEKYYLPKNEELLRLKGNLRKQETIAKFFEIVADAFKAQQWNMKSYIENQKNNF